MHSKHRKKSLDTQSRSDHEIIIMICRCLRQGPTNYSGLAKTCRLVALGGMTNYNFCGFHEAHGDGDFLAPSNMCNVYLNHQYVYVVNHVYYNSH